MAATPKKPADMPFHVNYAPSWSAHHIKMFHGGRKAEILLDKQSGAGFESKGTYLFGHFSMQIKLVGGDSAGTVTAFYLSSTNAEHDEIDFEFLGNRSGQPYILQTNVFTGGKGDREQRIYLWFDPTKDYHSYTVLWNMYQIVLFIDEVPIRVFKNCKDLGVRYPFNQPMKIYSSLWNGDDWATQGGKEKTDWSKAPFIASYRGFYIDGCEASVNASECPTLGRRWWDQEASGTWMADSTGSSNGSGSITPSTITAPIESDINKCPLNVSVIGMSKEIIHTLTCPFPFLAFSFSAGPIVSAS